MTENERKFREHGYKYIMIMEKNKLNGMWMCWIPGTSQMYAIDNKRSASKFVEKVNAGIASGEIDTNNL